MKEKGNTFGLILLVISACVAAGLWLRLNMWAAIACYWTVLAVKNAAEYRGRNK